MADSLLGKQLDEYRLEQLLGQGGMARVYRGLDTVLKRYVAIKVIDAQFREDSEYARRFELEAQSLGQLNHPNIVQLYRYGRVDDVLYMAMSYIEGSDVKAALDDYHATGEMMALDERLRILRESASALDYIHSKGVIHRDIKPANIMLDKGGRAIITDFGLALMTQVGTMGEIFGTPQYLSPEQAISSAAVVPQSDLYSLGIIAYEMFTGQIPFDGPEPMTVAIMHMNDEPPAPRSLRPEISEAVEAVLLKAIEKEPENRYPTGLEFVQALEAAVKGDSELKRKSTMPRMSIPQIVALEMEKNPLPPIPAAVTPMQKKSAEMPSITARAAETGAHSVETTPHIAPVTQASTKPPVTNPPSKPRTAAAPKATTEQRSVKAKRNPVMTYLPYAIGGTVLALLVIIGILLFVNANRPNPDGTATAISANATATAEMAVILASSEVFPYITETYLANITATAEQALRSTEGFVYITETYLANVTELAITQSSLNATATSLAAEASTLAAQNTAFAQTQAAPTPDNSSLFNAQTQAAANLTRTASAGSIAVVATASPAPRTVELLFTWDRDRWLVIENLSDNALDLSLLSLTEREHESRLLSGESFGENVMLQQGQCVAFAQPRRIDDIDADCDLGTVVGMPDNDLRVWRHDFNVYYLNTLNPRPIQECQEARNGECRVEILIQ
jgi:serine/threonine protein kinase